MATESKKEPDLLGPCNRLKQFHLLEVGDRFVHQGGVYSKAHVNRVEDEATHAELPFAPNAMVEVIDDE